MTAARLRSLSPTAFPRRLVLLAAILVFSCTDDDAGDTEGSSQADDSTPGSERDAAGPAPALSAAASDAGGGSGRSVR